MDLKEWRRSSSVTLEVSDGGEQVQEYRITFGTCSNYDLALYGQRRTKVTTAIAQKFGSGWSADDEAMALLNVQLSHLVILAGLKRVEVKEGETCQETLLPAAWYDLDRFPHEAPAGMINTLVQAVFDAGNPQRLFSLYRDDEEEKKILRLIVKPPEPSPEA
jgi:hypothetical protein